MRWAAFVPWLAILGAALVAQTALAPALSIWGARPDWVLIIVVFFALHASQMDAVALGWLTGLAADLLSVERCGLLAGSYLLVAATVVSIREYLFVRQATTQALLCFALAAITQLLWLVYRRVMYDFPESVVGDFSSSVLLSAVYTGLFAPLIHQPLVRVLKPLGLGRPRRLDPIRYPTGQEAS